MSKISVCSGVKPTLHGAYMDYYVCNPIQNHVAIKVICVTTALKQITRKRYGKVSLKSQYQNFKYAGRSEITHVKRQVPLRGAIVDSDKYVGSSRILTLVKDSQCYEYKPLLKAQDITHQSILSKNNETECVINGQLVRLKLKRQVIENGIEKVI